MILGGTDTKRVEALRAIMADYERERQRMPMSPSASTKEGRARLVATNRLVTLNRISAVLADDWEG